MLVFFSFLFLIVINLIQFDSVQFNNQYYIELMMYFWASFDWSWLKRLICFSLVYPQNRWLIVCTRTNLAVHELLQSTFHFHSHPIQSNYNRNTSHHFRCCGLWIKQHFFSHSVHLKAIYLCTNVYAGMHQYIQIDQL
jgi:hypothetical protein